MIKSWLEHLQLNLYPENAAFYKELFNVLGWSVLYEDNSTVGIGDENKTNLWFMPAIKNGKNDYDIQGMNHLSVSVSAQVDVDAMVAYLGDHGVENLFQPPRHRPDFTQSPDQTYYQVMFESPDRNLFDVACLGPLPKQLISL
jgi:catechol 2,3-dioxygenase-like lactoylglutathione lyase family enzyme